MTLRSGAGAALAEGNRARQSGGVPVGSRNRRGRLGYRQERRDERPDRRERQPDAHRTQGAIDDNGHGTLVAGIAAGSSAPFPGAAATARLVSIRVVTSDGSARTSDVIAAADWIFQNRARYGIRVANFSFTRRPLRPPSRIRSTSPSGGSGSPARSWSRQPATKAPAGWFTHPPAIRS